MPAGATRRAGLPPLSLLRLSLLRLSLLRLSLLGLVLSGLGGCSIFDDKPHADIQTVGFQVARGANDDTPVAIDLVLVGKPEIVETIGHLSAAEWFARKTQFGHDYPDGLTVLDWELVPGQAVPATKLHQDERAWAAYMFANYAGPGEHRAAVTNFHDVAVTLGRDDLTVSPLK